MDGPEKWRILRLHVEDDIALTTLAQDTGLGLRTLQRWHQQYKTGGIAALESQTRHDSGSRRTHPELKAFIERLGLRNLSTFLGHLLSFVVEFAGGVFSSWSGGLIQAVVGNAGGTGWWRTNRSGWAI